MISRLLGSASGKATAAASSGPRSIEDVERALALVVDQRDAARTAIAEAMRFRNDQLLVDGSDAKIAELDLEADKHRLVVERCDAAELLLLAELSLARSRARQLHWFKLRDAYFPVAKEYLGLMRQTLEGFEKVRDARDAALRMGFGSEAAAMLAIPPAIAAGTPAFDHELVNQFERALERGESVAFAQPKPTLAVAASPSPATPQVGEAKMVEVEIVEPPFEVFGRLPGRPGEKKRVPLDVAEGWVRSGVGKWVGAPPTSPKTAPPKLAPPPRAAPAPSKATPAPPKPASPAPPKFEEPLPDSDGNVAIVVMRAGFTLDGKQCPVTSVHRVPLKRALAALRTGGVAVADEHRPAQADPAVA